MSASDLLASTVMQGSASLMNDTSRSVYTYNAQLPYLRIALDELQEYFQLHDIPVTQLTSSVINIPIGTSQIVYNGVGVPSLPSDFIEPTQLWERQAGVDPFVKMTRKEFLPHNLEGTTISSFLIYTWNGQIIKFLASSRSNDIKLDYVGQLFSTIADENAQINVVNAKTFLEYRTAGLCAEFIERNKLSSDAMNAYAVLSLDRVTGIEVKGKQNIFTRRRPFRAAWKRR